MIRKLSLISQMLILAVTVGACACYASPKFLSGEDLLTVRGGEDCTNGPDLDGMPDDCEPASGFTSIDCTEKIKRCNYSAGAKTKLCIMNGGPKAECKDNEKCKTKQYDDNIYDKVNPLTPCTPSGL